MSYDNQDQTVVEESADLSTDEPNDDLSSDESYEHNDSTRESDGETERETSHDRQPETAEQRAARIRRQAEREAKKQGISLQEYLGLESKEGGKESRKETRKEEVETDDAVMERLDRGDLRYEGIKDRGEQDIIIEYARWKGVDVLDAMNIAAVKAELKEYRAKSATPSPSRRTTQGTQNDVAYWASQMKKGVRPPTAELRRQARDYLAKNR